MSEKQTSSSTLPFILGVIVGAAIVYLTSTDSGKKVSKQIKKKTQEFLDSLESDLSEETEFSKANHETPVFDKGQNDADNVEYIKEIQNRGRTVSRRFFKRH